ncbi:hypothetical protein DV735_g4506, partial [Chaetothyriales sp. CBS 134920]
MPEYDFLVGTFNTAHIYTLTFSLAEERGGKSSLAIAKRHDAIGSHSWLHLTPPFDTAQPFPAQPRGQSTVARRNLYATAWTEPPSVVAYAVESPTSIKLLGQGRTKARSGYVTASDKAVYSAGGATGEVFAIDPATGGFLPPPSPQGQAQAAPSQPTTTTTAPIQTSALSSTRSSLSSSSASLPASSSTSSTSSSLSIVEPLQILSFVEATGNQKDDGSVLDFGGLRHGAHSADLSPDGSLLYVADIGRNAIWTYNIDTKHDGRLELAEKLISPRTNDGPRHVWPHPAGKVVYVLQEHTSHVDVFDLAPGPKLQHVQGVRIIPDALKEQDFWADEVRNSLSNGAAPRWIYASTRGLEASTKGWLAVIAVDADGHVDTSAGDKGVVALWETPTSGGWANAVQPGPTVDGVEYLALTDSEDGWVFVVSWDGKEIKEVARQKLDPGAGAATAVWL